MNIPGYDAWKLEGPPEYTGPVCDYCENHDDIRVESPGHGRFPPCLICADCFTPQDEGPCFDDLQTADDYYQERVDAHAEYLLEARRDENEGE